MDEIKILIADDDPGTCETLSDILEERGYTVSVANTGQEAIDKGNKTAFDVVLIDIKLPDMDGISVIGELKKSQPNLVSIIITGYASVENAIHALEKGASRYFIKPLVFDEVLHSIRELVQSKAFEKKFRESEQRYRYLFEYANDAIFTIDSTTHRLLDVNEKAATYLGYTRKELLRLSLNDLFLPETFKRSEDIIKELKEKGSVVAEQTQQRKDGTEVPVEISSRIIEYGGQQVIQSFVRDITERNLVEEKLKESEERYRYLFEQAPVSIILVDKDGQMVDVNPYHISQIGKNRTTKKDYIGKNLATYPSVVNAGLSETYAALLREKPFDLKDVYFPTTSGGTEAYLNVKGVPLFKEGKVIGAIVLHEDITTRKKAEKSLRDSEERYRSLTETATDAIISANSDGNIISWNKGAQTIFGYKEIEVLEKPLTMLMPERYREAHKKGLQRVKTTGKFNLIGKVIELHGLRKDKSEFSLEASFATWKTGKEFFFSGIIRDITERKQAEEELRQYENIVSSSTDMIALLDKRFMYIAVNQAYLNAFEKTSEEIIGYTVSQVFGEEVFESVIKPNALRCLAGEEISYQTWFEFPSAGRKYMDVTYNPYTDADNNVKGFVVNARNTTERKKAEDELNKAYKELGERTEKLEKFHRITVGRELEMVKLKEEVNSLLEKSGLPKQYEAPDKIGKENK